MVIDTHAHIIVPEITRQAGPEEVWRPRVFLEDGQQVIETAGRLIRSTVHEFVHIEGVLEAQEASGVDQVLLCPWVNLLRYDASPQDALRSGQVQNRALARLAQDYPERVRALGTVPLQDPVLAARELSSLMQEPGLFGVEVAASVTRLQDQSAGSSKDIHPANERTYLGDDRLRPFWAAAEETGAIVFIHPTTRGFEQTAFDQYYLWNTVGNPLETTITAAHMIMAGVMESFPRLKILLAHGGGALLSLRGRLRHSHSFQPLARSRLRESPVDSLRRFYFDTVVHDLNLLQDLVSFAGADRVMVGSDYPFDMGVSRPAEIVRALGLPPQEEGQILSGNALRLMEKLH